MTPRTKSALVGCVLSLAACGSAEQARDAAPGRSAAPLTRTRLNRFKHPLIRVRLERSGAIATLVQTATNGAHVTWTTADGVALITRDGVLSGTRGLGLDLMSSDTAETRAALAMHHSGHARRTMHWLNGADRMLAARYQCTIARVGAARLTLVGRATATRHLHEICTGSQNHFRNDYWIGRGGVIWQSRQWVSPTVGHLTIQRLIR